MSVVEVRTLGFEEVVAGDDDSEIDRGRGLLGAEKEDLAGYHLQRHH